MEKRTSIGRRLKLFAAGVIALVGVSHLLRRRKRHGQSPEAVHQADLYATPESDAFVSPIRLEIDAMERMFLYNFEGDDEYNGLELQLFDHPSKGQGAAALMWRTDETVDFYMTPGLRLDRDKVEVGAGVGEWITQDFDYRCEITPRGLDCAVALTLKDGRPVRLVVRENRRRPGKALNILAPMGTGIRAPRFFPFFWLIGIDLVRVSGTEARLQIGETTYPPIRLPVPMPHSGAFAYFVRCCADPLLVLVNRAYAGPLRAVTPDTATGFAHEGMTYDLTLRDGHYEIARASVRNAAHEASIRFAPPLPDLLDLKDGAATRGRFALGVDAVTDIVRGAYEVQRAGQEVRVRLYPTENWKPRGTIRQRLTLWFFPPVFRTWPKTYEWSAKLDLSGADGSVMMSSGWRRTGPDAPTEAD
ncbi:MAG: hypothetical protein Kow00120_02840 [Anaerolineae bacterium]